MRLLIVLLSLLSFFSYSQSWMQLTDFPSTKRDDGVSFTINNRAYCGTGLDEGFSPTRDFYMLDMVTDNWIQVQSLPINKERQYATAQSFLGKGYVFGGSNNSGALNDLWKYSPVTNNWIELAALPDSGRGGSSSFILSNKLFILGGKTTSGRIINEVWCYDFTTDLWSKKNDLPNTGMWRGMAFSNDSSAYIGLGLDSTGGFNSVFWEYNPSIDSWSVNTNINLSSRTYPAYSAIGDTVFVYGGYNSLGQLINDFDRIEIQNQTVTPLNNFTSFARKGGMAFCSNDAFYITTGVTLTARVGETWKSSYILGVDQNKEYQDLFLYQKGNYLIVKSSSEINAFSLFNSMGKRIKVKLENNHIDIRNLSSGVYFYKAIGQQKEYAGKIRIAI